DSFAPNQPISSEAAEQAFGTWPEVYQKTVDGRPAIWAKRHPA
ncbi:MAG TPA: oxidoreductase, partial [Novosphingobium sp.]|nr:oxidoreductase [Novosphingobium sp.]